MSEKNCKIGEEEPTASEPPRLWRNGMDFEPKKTYPPDYSNVPDVRSWQMSPFSQERFDLDEIQRAEKLGVKGKAELERLKQKYGMVPKPPEPEKPECPKCAEREKQDKLPKKKKCTNDLLYQPYGPTVVSSVSFSKPESNKTKLYGVLGPSRFSAFTKFKSEPKIPVPCPGVQYPRDFGNVYIPYGPYGEIRFSPDMYVPMGPSVLPTR